MLYYRNTCLWCYIILIHWCWHLWSPIVSIGAKQNLCLFSQVVYLTILFSSSQKSIGQGYWSRFWILKVLTDRGKIWKLLYRSAPFLCLRFSCAIKMLMIFTGYFEVKCVAKEYLQLKRHLISFFTKLLVYQSGRKESLFRFPSFNNGGESLICF